jgi:hypothetical protein
MTPNNFDDKIRRMEGIVGDLGGLANRFAPPPGTKPVVVQDDEDDIPWGEPKRNIPKPAARFGSENSHVQPRPQPVVRPAKKRDQQQVDDLDAAVASIPDNQEIREPVTTRQFVKEIVMSLSVLGNLAWLASPKGIAGTAMFQLPVAIVGAAFWTPPVAFFLLVFGVYFRHVGNRERFEQTWQIAIVFLIMKVFCIAVLGGTW